MYTWVLELWKAFDRNILLGAQSETDPGIEELSSRPLSSKFLCRKMTGLLAIKTYGCSKKIVLSSVFGYCAFLLWHGKERVKIF